MLLCSQLEIIGFLLIIASLQISSLASFSTITTNKIEALTCTLKNIPAIAQQLLENHLRTKGPL